MARRKVKVKPHPEAPEEEVEIEEPEPTNAIDAESHDIADDPPDVVVGSVTPPIDPQEIPAPSDPVPPPLVSAEPEPEPEPKPVPAVVVGQLLFCVACRHELARPPINQADPEAPQAAARACGCGITHTVQHYVAAPSTK